MKRGQTMLHLTIYKKVSEVGKYAIKSFAKTIFCIISWVNSSLIDNWLKFNLIDYDLSPKSYKLNSVQPW